MCVPETDKQKRTRQLEVVYKDPKKKSVRIH